MTNLTQLSKQTVLISEFLEFQYYHAISNMVGRRRTKKETIAYCQSLIEECKSKRDIPAVRRAIKSYLQPFGYSARADRKKLMNKVSDKAFEIDFGHIANQCKQYEKAKALPDRLSNSLSVKTQNC